ncbi:MAG: SDR family NAD(P)-dependent oxidoreductase [Suipraeoptans sp.]
MKTVLITGSSRGIGKAAAIYFAKRNYHVFINCNTSIDELNLVENEIAKIKGSKCTMVIGDVGNPMDVKKMFEVIRSECDGLDLLINNAGISYWGLLSDMKDADWNNIISTNLSSCFYCSREALNSMLHKKQGKILNISSMWGYVGSSCEVAYSASKSGIDGFTKALAKELAPSNIQVNALSLGVIDTKMNSMLNESELDTLQEDIPAGRFGDAHEVAEMIGHIVDSPTYLTGQIIRMDGGYL